MTFRKLTAEDGGAFRELRKEMCGLHPEAFSQTPEEIAEMPDEKFLEWLNPSDAFPEKFVLAAFDGDRMVGTAGFRRDDSTKERHRAWIWTVYVRSEYRGRGISKQLMQRIIEGSRVMQGLEMLTLQVAVTQTAARALYGALGFEVSGRIPRLYKLADGRYIDQDEMVLRL